MYRTGRDGHAAIVLTEVLKDLVELWHSLLALDDGGLQIIRDQNLGNTAYMLEEVLRSKKEVLHFLREHSHCKAIVCGWQAGYEDLYVVDLARIYVHILHLATSEVKECLLASHVEVFEDG